MTHATRLLRACTRQLLGTFDTAGQITDKQGVLRLCAESVEYTEASGLGWRYMLKRVRPPPRA